MPNAPAVACHCGALNCQKHNRVANAREHDRYRGSAASRGYGHIWTRKIRPMIMRRDPTCRDPFGIGCTQQSTIGDHIIPKPDGGTDSLEHNLQGLCDSCHNRKIKLEQLVRFVKGCDCKVATVGSLPAQGVVLTTCAAHAASGSWPIAQWCKRTSELLPG
jgi:5-methylcytosine-specific restriction enzyme A